MDKQAEYAKEKKHKMEFDIYKCTVYTEQMRLASALKGKKLSDSERKSAFEKSRANAMALIGLSSYPVVPKKRKAYALLNSLFVENLRRSDKFDGMLRRTIKPIDLIPILVDCRKKALEEYPNVSKAAEGI